MTADYYSCDGASGRLHDTVDDAVIDYLAIVAPQDWPADVVVLGYVEADEEAPAGEQYYCHDEECDEVVVIADWVREHEPQWPAPTQS